MVPLEQWLSKRDTVRETTRAAGVPASPADAPTRFECTSEPTRGSRMLQSHRVKLLTSRRCSAISSGGDGNEETPNVCQHPPLSPMHRPPPPGRPTAPARPPCRELLPRPTRLPPPARISRPLQVRPLPVSPHRYPRPRSSNSTTDQSANLYLLSSGERGSEEKPTCTHF